MSVFSRKMKRVEVIILIILPLCFLHAENVKQTARAALIYCKRPEYIPPVNDYDDICSNLGWTLEKWENAELDKLIKNLNCYDIVLCGRMYNFANPQPFEKYTKQWLAFMKRGGVIIVAPVMDSPIKWINALGPGFRLRPKGYTGTTRKTIANPKAKLNFGCVIARWAEFGQVSPHWVIANRNDQGMPIVMYQEVGNGLFLASAAYGAKGQRNSFPVEKDLRIIWNFIIDKRKNAVPVEVTSLAWGKKMLGENILQIAVKDKTAKTAKILPTVTLSRNRENIFSSPARNREIASVARQEISLPYSITSAVPDLITFTLRGPAGEIYFRSTGKINIEDLKAPLEKARVKLAKVEKIISFLKTVPVTASCRWLKGYIDNKAKEYSSLYREIDVLEKELERIAKQGSLPAWNGKSKIIRRETENVDKLNSELEVLAKRAKTWENLRLGTADRNKLFTLSEASSFDKVFRDRTWKKPVTRQLRFKMAANEYESAQLVVIPLAQKLEGVKISCSDLTGANGKNRITSENIDLHRVAYVFSSEGKWHPDPLLRNRPFNINSSQVVQPIWITVHTPTDTAPGEYKGVLTVQSREPADKISLPVSVKVWNFEIPQKL
ncbi:MAG: glycoside hydrolase domain-containing protein, partial [Victivallaceae bacterium]